jgi:LEA14-like dessication related protein
MRSIKRLLFITLLLGFTSGCAYFQTSYNTNKPTLALVDIKFKKANLFEQIFIAELRIENPNDFDLPVDNVNVELELENRKLGEGVTSQNFTVPANGEALFKMKIHTNLFSNLKTLKKIVDSKQEFIQYRLSGNVDVDLPLFLQDVHFVTTDAIPTPNFKL